MTQSQLEFQYNKAYHVLKTINKLQKEYGDLKAEYEKAVVIRSTDALKEYVDILSEVFPKDKVTSRGGTIRITFNNPTQYRSTNDILARIPKVDGKRPMKGHYAKRNDFDEIAWVELALTNQFLKSTLNIFQLPRI